ncbi:hypothetical protein TRVL_04532 [Trypanosoma vivax]|nr:hypothetical protein TRVL_04532 [Trypanosoma vivax]
MLLSVGVVLSHLLSSVLEEAIFYIPGFRYVGLLTFSRFFMVSLIAGARYYGTAVTSEPRVSINESVTKRFYRGWWFARVRQVPLPTYMMLSLLSIGNVYMTNKGSQILTYSVQMALKSSKLLFVVLMRYVLIILPTIRCASSVAEHGGNITGNSKPFSGKLGEMHLLGGVPFGGDMHGCGTCVCGRVPFSESDGTANSELNIATSVDIREAPSSSRIHTCSGVSGSQGKYVKSTPIYGAAVLSITFQEVFASALLVVGLIVFTNASLSRAQEGPHKASSGGAIEYGTVNNARIFFGVACLSVAILCDVSVCVLEEKYCFISYGASHEEVQFFVNIFSAIYGFAILVVSREVQQSFAFVMGHPTFLLFLSLFSVGDYFGMYCVLRIVSEYNGSTATVVTSVRKALSVLCSHIVYTKPIGFPHFVGLVMVVVGGWQYERARKEKR